jgi:outer membrane protein assembly factor BamB
MLTAGCAGILEAPDKDALPSHSVSSATEHRVIGLAWRFPLVDSDLGDGSLNTSHHSAPAVSQDGNRVFAGAIDGSFSCFDAQSGQLLWQKITNGPVEGEPTVVDDVVYVGVADGFMYAFRESDGVTLWASKTQGVVSGKPVVVGNKVLAISNMNDLFCLDANTGKWLWNYRRNVFPSGRFQVKGVANPTVVGDTVYAAFSDGHLVTLSLNDGSIKQIKKLAADNDRFTDVDTDPLVIDDILFVGSFSNGLAALDSKNLEEIWNYPVDGPSSMAYAEQTLYFTTGNSKVVALDSKSGKPRWIFSAKKGQLSRPIVWKDWLLASSNELSLIVLNRKTGRLIQVFNPGKGSNAPPTIFGNRLYWISNGETLYAMNIYQ